MKNDSSANGRFGQCDTSHNTNRDSGRNVRECDANARRVCHTEKLFTIIEEMICNVNMNEGIEEGMTPPVWKQALVLASVADLQVEVDVKWREKINVMEEAKDCFASCQGSG